MLSLFLLIVIILCVKPLFIWLPLKKLSLFLQNQCVQSVLLAKGEENLNPIYLSLLCGKTLPDEFLMKKVFISVGVVHLMVVSGAHLIFIEKTFKILPSFRFKNFILILFLLIYSLSAGFRPPAVRALFSVLIRNCNKKFKMFWSPYIRVQLSGLLCILCQNRWVDSLSLPLSWTASLGMSNPYLPRWKACVLTYLMILPLISHFGGLSPFSILINWLITPLAGALLLPLSLLTLPFGFLRPLTDKIWNIFLELLKLLTPFAEGVIFKTQPLNFLEMWIYICFLFIILEISFICRRRWICAQS